MTDNHHRQIVAQIRDKIAEQELAWKYFIDMSEADVADEVTGLEASSILHISIGSKQRPTAFIELETEHSNDVMFHRFRIRLGDFLNNNLGIRGQQYIQLDSHAMVYFLSIISQDTDFLILGDRVSATSCPLRVNG